MWAAQCCAILSPPEQRHGFPAAAVQLCRCTRSSRMDGICFGILLDEKGSSQVCSLLHLTVRHCSIPGPCFTEAAASC